MAGASDKVRFYQEQYVPELQDFARKQIFTTHEISAIARKRSDFEHTLNARCSQASDYARYAEFEMNLDSLRRKRVKRLGVKSSNHTGPRRIFFILNRATQKFQGDIGLWMQYIDFARKQKSNKKVSKILTSVLRLHPTKPELWIHAANYAMEEKGDMTEARSYMQRGMRFCKSDERLWVEYARLELIYIAKIAARMHILGLEGRHTKFPENINNDTIHFPDMSAEEIDIDQQTNTGMDREALKKLGASPALLAAVPIAIFDAAMRQFNGDKKLCLHMFDMVASFEDVPCQGTILAHVMETLQLAAPESSTTLFRLIQQPLKGVKPTSTKFPTLFRLSLARMKICFNTLDTLSREPQAAESRCALGQLVLKWMLPYLGEEGLDVDMHKVIVMTLRKVWAQYQGDIERNPGDMGAEVACLLEDFERNGAQKMAEPARAWALRLWPK